MISYPNTSMNGSAWALRASESGSEWGRTIVGIWLPLAPGAPSPELWAKPGSATPPWPGIVGRFALLPCLAAYRPLRTSMLAALPFVAILSSISLTLMKGSFPVLPSSCPSTCPICSWAQVSLIFLTRGSLRDGRNPRIKFIMRCLKGWPRGSM